MNWFNKKRKQQTTSMMKKCILFFGIVIFIFSFTSKAFSQENEVEKMRFDHDFTIVGLKTEQQAAWVDSIMKSLPQVISCTTDFKTNHTKMVVHEAFNSPELIQKIVVKLGFDVDRVSYVSKYEQ